MSQLTFDIDTLIREADVDASPAWTGAPLRYHEEHRTPAELDAAFDRWIFENGNFGCVPYSHMWHRQSYGSETYPETQSGHSLVLFGADARCDGDRYGHRDHAHTPGDLPEDIMEQAICEPCTWRSISNDQSSVIEAWHDHALPGWRSLPVIPEKIRIAGQPTRARLERFHAWIEEHYPEEWKQPGHPIITQRTGIGTRHIPGASPWGGYDLSHTAVERPEGAW